MDEENKKINKEFLYYKVSTGIYSEIIDGEFASYEVLINKL